MTTERTQLAVIGGGPGGYAAAFLAADLGMDVCIIDPSSKLGGVCLHRGCIPSKALLHVAHVIEQAEQAQHWGVTLGTPLIDVDKLRAWKNSVTDRMAGGLSKIAHARKVGHIVSRS